MPGGKGQPSNSQPMPASAAPEYTVDDPSGVFIGGAEGPGRVLGPTIWGGADYLLWVVKTMHYPPLVQGITGAQPGETSFQSSQITQLFPNGNHYNPLDGVRGTIGFWLNCVQTVGFEANYFVFTRTATLDDLFASNPSVILARPFINGDTGAPSFVPVSTLDGVSGSIRVYSTFQAQGGEANLLLNSMEIGPQLNLLAGFRYLQVAERLEIEQQSIDTANSFSTQSIDSFGTLNQFYGGQLGLRWSYDGPRIFVNLTGKIAFGAMEEHATVYGATSITANGATSVVSGGLLALPTNGGSYNRTQTAYVPEAIATVGCHLTPWASVFVGYNFLYISNLARPGKLIDTTLNPENFPGGAGGATALRPQFQFHDESMWMQGVNVGLTLRY